MSATYGIAGFVDGFIDGRDTRNRWEDRKREIERQKRFDEIAVGQDKRAAEEHARRMKILDTEISETEREIARRNEMEGIFSDAADAASASMEADQAAPLPAAPPAASGVPSAPATGASLPLGLPSPGAGAADAFQRRVPLAGLQAQAAAQPALPASLPLGRPGKSSGVSPPASLVAAASKGPVRAPTSAPSARQIVPAMGLPSDPVLQTQGPGPTGMISPELYEKGILPRRFTQDPAIAPKPTAEQAAAKAAAEAEEANKRQKMMLSGLSEIPGSAYKTIREQASAKLAAMQSPDAGKPIAAGSAGPTVASAPKAQVPASAPPLVRGLADTAMKAMAETATPAMQAASASASASMPAPAKGGAKSPASQEKYAKGFMDHYMEKGAPMVIEALMKRGEFDKALAFQEFLSRQQTKAGMDDWAKAAFAASTGDMDTFSKHIMSAYNRLDYFGDDTTIVEDQSGFTSDKAGNITGAKITFRDEKTGNTFDQVFSDPNDLVRLGITLLAPEQAFEYYHQQQQAAAQAAMGLTPKEAAESAAKKESEMAKRVDDIAKTIYEGSKQLDGTYSLTYEEARRQATAAASAPTGQPVGMPPVVYRP